MFTVHPQEKANDASCPPSLPPDVGDYEYTPSISFYCMSPEADDQEVPSGELQQPAGDDDKEDEEFWRQVHQDEEAYDDEVKQREENGGIEEESL